MRKILIIISLFLVFCKYALTEEENGRWICYGEINDGNKLYYDIESINWISDDIVEVWDKTIYSENSELKKVWISYLIKKGVEPEKARRISENKTLYKINIKNKKIMTLYDVYYDKNGKVLHCSDYNDNSTWLPIVPGSIGEGLWKEMYEFQKIEILKKLIEKKPKNSIFYYLLGKEWDDFISGHIPELAKNERMDTFLNLREQYFKKAVENSISIDTFPFEMVSVKNAVIEKEDLFKILRGIFICSSDEALSCDEYIKTIEEIKKWWISKQKEIRPDLEIIFIVDQFPEGKKEIRIETLPEKLCVLDYVIGSSLLNNPNVKQNPDEIKTKINSIINEIKTLNPSSPYIEILEKAVKERFSESEKKERKK